MKKKMTKKEKREDMKEGLLKLIKLNSEDGCTMREILDFFNKDSVGRTRAMTFIKELQIDGLVREVNFHRFKIYKAVSKWKVYLI